MIKKLFKKYLRYKKNGKILEFLDLPDFKENFTNPKKCQADILHYNRDFWGLLDSDGLSLKKSNLGRAQVKSEPRFFNKVRSQASMNL